MTFGIIQERANDRSESFYFFAIHASLSIQILKLSKDLRLQHTTTTAGKSQRRQRYSEGSPQSFRFEAYAADTMRRIGVFLGEIAEACPPAGPAPAARQCDVVRSRLRRCRSRSGPKGATSRTPADTRSRPGKAP